MNSSQILKLIARIVLVLLALCGIAGFVVTVLFVKANGGGHLTVPLMSAILLGSLYLIYYAVIL